MGVHCVAIGCTNRNTNGNRSLSFHRFPHNKPEVLKQWIEAVRRVNWQPSIYSRLCSAHFTNDCYLVRPGADKKLLKETAVPSIFNFSAKSTKVKRRKNVLEVFKQAETPEEDSQPANKVEWNADGLDSAAPEPFLHIKVETPGEDSQPDNNAVWNAGELDATAPQPFLYIKVEPENGTDDTIDTPKMRRVVDPDRAKRIALRRKVKCLQAKLRRRNQRIAALRKLVIQLKNRLITKSD